MVQQVRLQARTSPTKSSRRLRCARILESRKHVMWSEAAFAVFTMVPNVPNSTSSDGAYARPLVNLQLGRHYPQLRFFSQYQGRGFCTLPRLVWRE